MASTPAPTWNVEGGCPDCGRRAVELPPPLPAVGDDFDWLTRDYDGFRRVMLEDLASRLPERRQWAAADFEVVLIEVLAALLDQLSDMADRVAAEAFLETARHPGSVRRLLAMVGYSAVNEAFARREIEADPSSDHAAAAAELETLWRRTPLAMEQARAAGPRHVHSQHRMVTLADYAVRLQEHPLVLRARAGVRWTGSWQTVRVAVVAWQDRLLDDTVPDDKVRPLIDRFHRLRCLSTPNYTVETGKTTIRSVLRTYVDAYRMAGQEVQLLDAVRVPILISFSIRVPPNYYRSEVARAVGEALGRGPAGFFAPGRLRFGEDLHVSDVIETLMALPGVEHVCINRFKRLGSQFPDRSESGAIVLDGLEIAVCHNDPTCPQTGYWRMKLHGGQRG